MNSSETIKDIALNRRARFDFHIDDTLEAGLVLKGTEVKSLRAGKASVTDCYATIQKGEGWVHNLQISPYEQGNRYNQPEKRPRKLLLHKKEIAWLAGEISKKGYTIVGLKLYFKGSKVKLLLGVAKGKKSHDKREDIKAKDSKREMDRALKESRKG